MIRSSGSGKGLGPASNSLGTFDLPGLLRQQEALCRTLPRQVAASCLDAFGFAALSPGAAAEAFVVHLLFDPKSGSSSNSLLQRFIERRVKLLRSLLDVSGASGEGSRGLQLAAAAMAFEGTVVLASGLAMAGAGGGPSPMLTAALSALGAPGDEASAEDQERATIEGRKLGTSASSFRQRVDSLAASLQQTGGMMNVLGKVGPALALEWTPEDPALTGRGLSARLGRLIKGSSCSCKDLGELQQACADRVSAYRRSLSAIQGLGNRLEDWNSVWSAACAKFCTGRVAPRDAISMIAANIEAACAEVVRERLQELQLQLVAEPVAEEGKTREASSAQDEGSEAAQRRDEIAEIRRLSRLRIMQFDEQLGKVLADADHIAREGEIPPAVAATLLEVLKERLEGSCKKLEARSFGADRSLLSQRVATAVALEVLLEAATGGNEAQNMARVLRTSSSSGNAGLAARAKELIESLKRQSEDAYCVWARLAVPGPGPACLASFWRLADDEVGPSCGWGSAKFTAQASGRAVPVPMQSSPTVFELLVLASRRSAELAASGAAAATAAAALKAALCESFVEIYKAQELADMPRLKRSGSSHLLQLLFDLNFLRIVLSAAAGSGSSYEVLLGFLQRAEATMLADPVDRLCTKRS